MIEVVSIRFKNRGKSYSFAPNGMEIGTGVKQIMGLLAVDAIAEDENRGVQH